MFHGSIWGFKLHQMFRPGGEESFKNTGPFNYWTQWNLNLKKMNETQTLPLGRLDRKKKRQKKKTDGGSVWAADQPDLLALDALLKCEPSMTSILKNPMWIITDRNIYTLGGSRHLFLMPFSLLCWSPPPPRLFCGAGVTLSPWSIMACRMIHDRHHSSPSTTLGLTLHSELDFCYLSGCWGVRMDQILTMLKSVQKKVEECR